MNILRNQIESESDLQYRGYKPDISGHVKTVMNKLFMLQN